MQSLIIQLKKISLALVITQIAILPVAQAATIEVNKFDDVSADDGNCTLREAIISANTNPGNIESGCISGEPGEDRVEFTGIGAGQSILLTQAPALIIDSGEALRIIGPGAGLLTIDGNKSIRTNAGIFYLSDASAQITDLTISNGARYWGGGIYALDAIVGLINTVVSGNTATLGDGGGIFAYRSDIYLTDSTVSGNSAETETKWGGGISATSSSTVTLTNSTVSGNVAFWAGGIMANSNSTVTLTNSTVSDNVAAVWGGGILAQGNSTLNMDSSTVSGNWAYSVDSGSGHSGGGIIAGSGSAANLSNSTVSGNYAYQYGGGIAVNNSSLSLTNTTVSGNRARLGGAGISVRAIDGNSSSASLSNSVIAYSTAGPAEDGPDCSMFVEDTGSTTSVTADDHNIIADGTCGTSALDVDPMLGPLADNGGPTKTHKLLAGSPAIDAGDNAVCDVAPVNSLDQRGFARPLVTNCDIGAFEFKNYLQGLTIIKHVINDDGTGSAVPLDFTLHLTGGTLLGSTYDGTEEMKSGDTPDVEAGTPYTLSETTLPGYTETGIACTDDDGGAVVTHPVNLSAGQDVTCTISNDDDAVAPPQLTLVKTVVNDNGGNAAAKDFLPTVDGNVVVSGEKNAYFAGTPLTLNETLLPGYAFTSLTGDPECPAALGGTVTLAPGDDITCTITNDDVAPQLTLTKVVNGGNAAPDAFLPSVGGAVVVSGVKNTYTANTPLALDETQLQGYAFTSLTGDAKCPAALGDPITLAPGDDITCTITNTAIAQLTLIKTVVNDNGGTAAPDAFLPTVDGTVVVSGVKNAYIAGTLALNETLLPGYTFTSLTGDVKCPAVLGGTVTLASGDDITCTITNDDVAPQLTLLKTVVNDNGGDALPDEFLPTVDGTVVVSGKKNTYMANTPLALDETLLPGYTFTSLTGDAKCPAALGDPITLAPGDDITCTITNNDMQPGLTILKDVTNVNGGTAVESDFTLHLTGGAWHGTEEFVSGDTPVVEANEEYTLSETEEPGYTMTGIRCTDDDGGAGVAHPVTLNEGQNVTCTISNSDDPDDSTYYVIPIPDGGVSVINL